MPRYAPSPLVTDENRRPSADDCQWQGLVKAHEEQSGDSVSQNVKLAVLQRQLYDGELARHLNMQSARLTTYERSTAFERSRRGLRRELQTLWTFRPSAKARVARKEKARAKVTRRFYCNKRRHSKSVCRNFSAALKKKIVQPDQAGRYAGAEVDPETGKRKPTSGKGAGTLTTAPGLDACLLFEKDSNPDAYLFPLPMIAEGAGDLMALSRQLLFDRGAARSVCPSTYRPDVPIEPFEEIALHQADGPRVTHFGSKFLSVGVGTQKIAGRFGVMSVTKPMVAAKQVTDKGQGVWLNGDGGFILDVKSAKKVGRLGGHHGIIELKKQRGEYVISCEEQPSDLFPQAENESNPGIRVDMKEHEIEEERQAKVKRSPIPPSEKESEEHETTHATFRSWCEACVADRATEDSHTRSASESSVPSVAMDYRIVGRDTATDLATILLLVQRPHGAVGACQVLRKGPEPYACVLTYLDTWGLGEVLLKADNEPAIQALVDADRVKRDGRTMVKKSPKYSHQSNGAVENGVRIESLTRTYVCVLQEKLGYKVDSKSIVLPWLVRHAAYVLCRFVKRDDGRSGWARLRGKECDSPQAQIGETVDFKIVRGEMARLEPRWPRKPSWDAQMRVMCGLCRQGEKCTLWLRPCGVDSVFVLVLQQLFPFSLSLTSRLGPQGGGRHSRRPLCMKPEKLDHRTMDQRERNQSNLRQKEIFGGSVPLYGRNRTSCWVSVSQ